MKSLRNRMLVGAAVALAAICASAVPAKAQAAFQGTFTLPNDVRWQGSMFPAGDYSFKMDSATTPARIIVKGPNGSAFVTALVADRAGVSEQSTLTIEHRGGSSVIRELYLAEIGLRLHYNVPKAPKDKELAQVTTERLLVAMK